MHYFYISELLVIGALGLAVGGLLSIVSYRVDTKLRLLSRSVCPHCKRELLRRDIIPLASFIILGGRCRYCGEKISWRYPLIELATGLLFMVFAAVHFSTAAGLGLAFIRDCVAISFLILIFEHDFSHYLIPDRISLPAISSILLLNVLLGTDTRSMFWGVILGGGFFLGQYIISDGKWIGGGDIRLGILMGLILGWGKVIIALGLAYVIGAIVSLALIALKKKRLSGQMPFGTFLSIATIIVMLLGDWIIGWYL